MGGLVLFDILHFSRIKKNKERYIYIENFKKWKILYHFKMNFKNKILTFNNQLKHSFHNVPFILTFFCSLLEGCSIGIRSGKYYEFIAITAIFHDLSKDSRQTC